MTGRAGPPPDPRAWAVRHHGDQRYGERPYVSHLDDVAELARGRRPGAVTLAYLHDVVEDTDAGLHDVREAFGDTVAAALALLTDPPGRNRAERKAAAHERLAACPPELEIVLVVKAADRLANLRACVRDGRTRLLAMYRDEHPAFREAAFRPGLCDDLWTEMAGILHDTGST